MSQRKQWVKIDFFRLKHIMNSYVPGGTLCGGHIPRRDVSNMLISVQGYCMVKTANYDESHDWRHHQRVVNFVEKIAKGEKVNDHEYFLLQIAAWLHDILDHKYVEDLENSKNDMRSFLSFLRIPSTYIDRIMLWIMNTSWSKEKRGDADVVRILKEDHCARILADADRLDSVSQESSPNPAMPMGIYRCYHYSKMKSPNASEEELIEAVKKHCEEKLLILHEWIFTESGKKLAENGTKLIREWVLSH